MHNATSPTTPASRTTPTTPTASPQVASSLLSSLAEGLSPYSEGCQYKDLAPLLRHLHSTLEVLNAYALNNLGVDPHPVDVWIVDVIESASGMAAKAFEHFDKLESRLSITAKQLLEIAEQYGKEV